MAKKNVFGTVLQLGVIVAAAAVVYSQREEIRRLIDVVTDRICSEIDAAEVAAETEPEEADIVIDATGKALKETVEEIAEA